MGRRILLAFVILAVTAFAGCTKASDQRAASATSTPQPSAGGEAGDVLDVAQAKQGSAERAVFEFLRSMQVDALPLAVRSYHPRVLETMTVDSVLTALDSQQAMLETASIETEATTESEAGSLVTLMIRGADGNRKRHSYLMRRTGGSWRILYDSLLDGALAFQAQQRAMERIRASKPTPATSAEARRVSARFQRIFLEGEVVDKPQRRPRTTGAAAAPAAPQSP